MFIVYEIDFLAPKIVLAVLKDSWVFCVSFYIFIKETVLALENSYKIIENILKFS